MRRATQTAGVTAYPPHSAMKLIYDYIQEETVKRFPNMRYKVLGGFYFLRCAFGIWIFNH